MFPIRRRIEWVRDSIEQELGLVDGFLAEIVPSRPGLPGAYGDEPWLIRLFAKRQTLQSTLCEVKREIRSGLAQSDRRRTPVHSTLVH
jgi:hypothetical protein